MAAAIESAAQKDTDAAPSEFAARVEREAECVEYVERNRERMRYPAFKAAGLCTSTGVVEAGLQGRDRNPRQARRHAWTVAGVDAIIAPRCCKLSGRFEDFWERRSAARAAAA